RRQPARQTGLVLAYQPPPRGRQFGGNDNGLVEAGCSEGPEDAVTGGRRAARARSGSPSSGDRRATGPERSGGYLGRHSPGFPRASPRAPDAGAEPPKPDRIRSTPRPGQSPDPKVGSDPSTKRAPGAALPAIRRREP